MSNKYEHWKEEIIKVQDGYFHERYSREELYQTFKQRLMEELYAHFDEMDHGDRPLELKEYGEK